MLLKHTIFHQSLLETFASMKSTQPDKEDNPPSYEEAISSSPQDTFPDTPLDRALTLRRDQEVSSTVLDGTSVVAQREPYSSFWSMLKGECNVIKKPFMYGYSGKRRIRLERQIAKDIARRNLNNKAQKMLKGSNTLNDAIPTTKEDQRFLDYWNSGMRPSRRRRIQSQDTLDFERKFAEWRVTYLSKCGSTSNRNAEPVATQTGFILPPLVFDDLELR